MISANDGENGVLQSLEAGADDYIAKPLSYRTLQTKLLVGQRKLARQKKEKTRYEKELREEVIATTTAELINPLAVLKMLLELQLPKAAKDSELHNDLGEMQRAVGRIEQTLRKIRAWDS